jgi:hypothetical protein
MQLSTARYIEVNAGVRYWEDATVNGKEDTNGEIPFRVGNDWKPVIELATGQIIGWPEGTEADVHYKVCDDGEYWLLDENKKRIAKWASYYVPDRILCIGDRGYGDYIIFKVGSDGKIIDWKQPAIANGDDDEDKPWKLLNTAQPGEPQ